MTIIGAEKQITTAVLAWPETSAAPHRFGGVEYRLGTREIGHVHGDWMLDVPFPKRVRDALVASGQAAPHHLLPEAGWVSFYIREAADVDRAVQLLRQSYDIARKQKDKRSVD